MRTMIVLTALLVSLCGTALGQACALSPRDSDDVRNLSAQYRKAWLGNSSEKEVMALMSDTATILPHHGVKPLTGHVAIKSFWFPPNMASFQLLKLTMDPVHVEGCGEVAYVWGNKSVEWKMKESPTITFNAGTFLMVARKRGQRWLIERFMWDDPPNQTR